MNWSPFFRHMEKIALPIGPVIMGAMQAMSVKGYIDETKQKTRIDPLEINSQYKLRSPNSYQFEGGKHTPLKETQAPHMSLYE